jgi:hypothetical protein
MAYQSQDASTLCAIASAASGPFPPAMPSGWTLGTQISGSSYLSGIQAFFCSGTLPSNPSVTVYALSIGFNRPVFFPWYSSAMQFLYPLPAYILGGQGSSGSAAFDEQRLMLAAARMAPVSSPGDLGLDAAISGGDELARELEALGRRALDDASIEPDAARARGAFGPLIRDWRSLKFAARSRRGDPAALQSAMAAYNQRIAELPQSLRAMVAATTTGSGPNVDFGFFTAYTQIRTALWNGITVASGQAFYVLGHNIGAPPAQIAAIDFSPGRSSPTSPVASLQAYYFGQIAVGDSNFASTSATIVPNAYAVQYADDYVPSQPQSEYGYALTGQQIPLSGTNPDPYDSPWWQQAGNLYCQFLEDQASFLNTPTPAAVMSGGDLHLFVRGSHDQIRHQRVSGLLRDSRVWYAWKELGTMSGDAVPAAASLGDRRVLLAAPLPLGGVGVRLFDGYWHGWHIVPVKAASVALSATSPADVVLVAVTDEGEILHFRLDLQSGAVSKPVRIANPYDREPLSVELHRVDERLFAVLRPKDAARPIHTIAHEDDVWRNPTMLTESSGQPEPHHVRLGSIVRGEPRFLAISADRRLAIPESGGDDRTALIAAPVALAANDAAGGMHGVALGITAELRLVANLRDGQGWRGWNELPPGRFEDPVAGVIRDRSQRHLDEIARRAGLI